VSAPPFDELRFDVGDLWIPQPTPRSNHHRPS
jgi:hypothetical protein